MEDSRGVDGAAGGCDALAQQWSDRRLTNGQNRRIHPTSTSTPSHTPPQGSSLIPLWVLSLLLGRGSMVADLGGSLRQLVGLGQEQQPSFQADPCLLRRAGADADDAAWVVWDEWVACRRELLGGAAGDGDGAGWLATAPRHWGSGGSKAAAVLIELERAEARPLEWAVRQAMGNLPVAWKMVVVAGSEAVAATVEGLFDEEMGVGKVEVVRLPLDERKEDSKVCVCGSGSG